MVSEIDRYTSNKKNEQITVSDSLYIMNIIKSKFENNMRIEFILFEFSTFFFHIYNLIEVEFLTNNKKRFYNSELIKEF